MAQKQENLASKFSWWLIGGVLFLLIYLLGPILAPFLTAAILAYICNPLVDRIETWKFGKFKINRTFASLLVLAFVCLIIMMLLLIVVPMLIKEFTLVIERLPTYLANLRDNVEPWMQKNLGLTLNLDIVHIQKIVTNNMQAAAGSLTSAVQTIGTHGMTIIGWVANLLLVPIVLFYMLRDWHPMLANALELIPKRQQKFTKKLAGEIDVVLAGFLRGQLTVMLLMSAFYAVGLLLAGLDLAVPIGILSGLLGFVPYLGISLGMILAVLAGLLEFNSVNQLIPIFVVYGIGQVIESFWLTPTIVGDRIGLHPVMVIFALLAGGQLFGFTGVLLALPVSAAIAVALGYVRASYMHSDLYQ
jgi:predicted PurR-regulated permease PerM